MPRDTDNKGRVCDDVEEPRQRHSANEIPEQTIKRHRIFIR
jgi:hypothetical protein